MKKLTSQTLNIILIVAYLILGVILLLTPYPMMTIPCFLIAAFLLGYFFLVIRKQPRTSAFVEETTIYEEENLTDPEIAPIILQTDEAEVDPFIEEIDPAEEPSINIEDTLANLIKRDALLDLDRNKTQTTMKPQEKSRSESILNFVSIALIAIAILIAIALVLEIF